MATPTSVGVIELSSIGIGYLIEDEMLKAASVEVLIARTICSGKYIIVVGGSVSDVETSIRAGLAAAGEAIIDHLILPNVHESVFPGARAIGYTQPQQGGCVGSGRNLQRHERDCRGRRRRQGRPSHHASAST